jgi:hypothetical protein
MAALSSTKLDHKIFKIVGANTTYSITEKSDF